MSKNQDLRQSIHRAFGPGVATANLSDMQMPSPGQPVIPDDAKPMTQYGADVEVYCKTNKCTFLGQSEGDPSFLEFENNETKTRFKLPQAQFVSGFRGSEQAKP